MGSPACLQRRLSNHVTEASKSAEDPSPRLHPGLLCPGNSFEPILPGRPGAKLAYHGQILDRSRESPTLDIIIEPSNTMSSFVLICPRGTNAPREI